MNDHAVALSFAHALDGAPGLAGCQLCGHDVEVASGIEATPGELVLPAVLITSKSECLASSSTIAKATVEVAIESQADEDTSATHSARVAAVRDRLASQATVAAAFTGRDLAVLGRLCPVDTDPEAEQRAFRTVLTYRVGYSS